MNNLYDGLDKYYNKTELELAYKENLSEDSKLYSGYLKNLRDLKKLLNAFNFYYQIFKKKNIHINISDLFLVTAIKTFNYPLWETIFKNKEIITLNKKPFTDERYISENRDIFIEIDPNSNVFIWRYKVNDNLYIEISKLKPFEVGVIQSLFPYNQLLKDNPDAPIRPPSFYYAISDHDKYSAKRIKDSLQTFMLYFQFNPAESHLNDILVNLENYHINPQKINEVLNTDTDYSDLFDIVVSNYYKDYRTPQIILNIMDLILKRIDIFEIIYQEEKTFIFSPTVNKMKSIPLTQIKGLIKNNIEIATENFDAFVLVIYDLFMYAPDRKERKDIRTELTEEENEVKNDLIDWLSNIFKSIDMLKISKATLWTLYYSYDWQSIIKSKVNDILKNNTDKYLLDFIMHFASEGQSSSISGDGKFYAVSFLFESLFDSPNTLQERLMSIKSNNPQLMASDAYIAYFGETSRFEREVCHLVDYSLKMLNPDEPKGFDNIRLED